MAHPSPLETETEAAPHTPTLADIALAEAELRAEMETDAAPHTPTLADIALAGAEVPYT